MPHRSFSRAFFVALALPALFLAVPAPATAGVTPARDWVVTVGQGRLATAALPAGPADSAYATSPDISQILVLPSGQVLATTRTSPPQRVMLNELRANGTLRQIGPVAPLPDFDQEEVADMAVDPRGRVYLLIAYLDFDEPAAPVHRLVEIDSETGETASSRILPARGIAAAADGLWALTATGVQHGYGLRKLDPDTLEMGPAFGDFAGYGEIGPIETDSAGTIYFRTELPCSPPCIKLGTADPASGAVAPAPPALYEETPLMETFGIARRCIDTVAARCLQGGRFRAEVAYEAYDGASGAAQAAPARSADTAIFSFFDPDNWELMVKVLDGCGINAKFWVYSSASTDVAYTMTVTDTETGAQKVYSNPLGRIALTVTDNQAFSCTP